MGQQWRSGSQQTGEAESARTCASWPIAFQHLLETVAADRFEAQALYNGGEMDDQLAAVEEELEQEVTMESSYRRSVRDREYFLVAVEA